MINLADYRVLYPRFEGTRDLIRELRREINKAIQMLTAKEAENGGI